MSILSPHARTHRSPTPSFDATRPRASPSPPPPNPRSTRASESLPLRPRPPPLAPPPRAARASTSRRATDARALFTRTSPAGLPRRVRAPARPRATAFARPTAAAAMPPPPPAAAEAAVAAARPNFVILFADDMGYSQPSAVSDRSAFAGDNGTISTPHLDRLAAEGVAFTSWYSAFHVCSPSRAAMMTGRLSVRAGIGLRGRREQWRLYRRSRWAACRPTRQRLPTPCVRLAT